MAESAGSNGMAMVARRRATGRVVALGIAAADWPMPGLLRSARAATPATADGATDDGVIWGRVRETVFGSRVIQADGANKVLTIDAPPRAEDAAIVPIAIRAAFDQGSDRRVRHLYLVIDGNPSPMSAKMAFGDASGRAEIETRVRIEQYTTLRAIAELDDGALFMATRFIKASGGCSAPAGKDPAVARATLGRMRLRVDGDVVQLQISHPNDSGLVMDQTTRTYAPAWFIRTVSVRLDDRPVFAIDTDFTISQNPHFRFRLAPGARGTLSVRAVDTQDRVFEQSWPMPATSPASPSSVSSSS